MLDGRTELARGRESYVVHAWLEAFESLSRADRAEALAVDDLELLARSAYMLGLDDEYVSALERAHHAHADAGDVPRSVRCAFWIGHSMMFRGQAVRARAWFGRAESLLERYGHDCVESGWLLIPVWLGQMGHEDWLSGYATAVEAARIGARFADADLLWLARNEQARALLKLGRAEEGLRLVDEVLVVADTGELSPIVTGIVYCNTIAFCSDVYEFPHAQEWTDALTLWCERQPEMVAHNGLCLVHRAEMLQLRGAWAEALEEAHVAAERFTRGVLNERACGSAFYRQAEVHRLRGNFAAAEDAYRDASRCGYEPQPGLGLLRLAQGNGAAAAAAIRRAVGETAQPLKRAGLLPAYVEIMLATGDVEAAGTASRQLAEIAAQQGSRALAAMSAHAEAAVALALGDGRSGLVPSRRAFHEWQELDAPYEAARSRVLVGLACRSLGDEESAELELAAARDLFEGLDAEPDAAWVDSLRGATAPVPAYGLTRREREVLSLVAAGKSNRDIAAALVISEHTVARHLQNIFAKLGVSSRTAATAFAFEHELV